MFSTDPCSGEMGSTGFLGVLRRLWVYRHCPIFLALFTWFTNIGLTVSGCGGVSVRWCLRFLRETCNRFKGLCHCKAVVVTLIGPRFARVDGRDGGNGLLLLSTWWITVCGD